MGQTCHWGHDMKGAVDAGGFVLLWWRYEHTGSQARRWTKGSCGQRA